MNASVLLTLNMGDDTYTANLTLTTSAPTVAAPFLFSVTQNNTDPVLEVAIVDSEHYFVGVAPPQSLLEKAGIAGSVKELGVVVANGTYHKDTHTFDE